MEKQELDYRKYYRDVKQDFEILRQEYPYSTMYMPPTVDPQIIIIRVIAVHSNIISISKAQEEDFLGEYSRELQLVIPFDYKEIGCRVYGGAWIQERQINKADRHFYKKEANGMREFCVGVRASFKTLDNVILENVKTVENMLIAYELVQKGVTPRAKLIGYAHGEKGERDYENDKRKYKSR